MAQRPVHAAVQPIHYIYTRLDCTDIWAHLFKTNDVVSERFFKIYIEWYANILKFFAEKNIRILYTESAKTVNEIYLTSLLS